MPNLQEQFKAAVEIVQNLPKEGAVTTSNQEKLLFYGLFKQATIGQCNTTKPGFWNAVEKYKWESWNGLGDMTREDAMNQYLTNLVIKIDDVNKEHNIENWMNGELYGKLQPMFEKIGRPMVKAEASEELVKNEAVFPEEEDSDGVKIPALSEVTAALSACSAVSDSEYCDAVDDEIQTRSRTSSYEIQEFPREKKDHSLKLYCNRVELQLKNISEQIDALSRIIETRNNHLLGIFKKATVYMFIPKKVSWLTIIFFFVWPFFTHLILRYFKRYIKFLKY